MSRNLAELIGQEQEGAQEVQQHQLHLKDKQLFFQSSLSLFFEKHLCLLYGLSSTVTI